MFILIECDDPDRLSILPLDGMKPNFVRELLRGSSLAEVANAIDGVEVETVKARHAAIVAGLRARAAVNQCVIDPARHHRSGEGLPGHGPDPLLVEAR